jgi:hypothetical protein
MYTKRMCDLLASFRGFDAKRHRIRLIMLFGFGFRLHHNTFSTKKH